MKAILCLIALTCVLALASAGRGRNRKNNEGCSEWTREECVPKRGDCGRGTQKGTRTGESCAVKEKTFKCRKPCAKANGGDDEDTDVVEQNGKCKYSKRGGERGECDSATNTRTIVLSLKKGGSECAPNKTITKPCRHGRRSRSPGGKGKRGGRGCRYTRGDWSECDPTTNMMSRTMTLKIADPNCEATKTVQRRCKKEKCKFGPWSEFGECQNGVRTKTRTVVSGGDACQSRTSKTKPCRN